MRSLARELGEKAFRSVGWREGTWQRVHSHFLAVRVRPVHYDYWRSGPHAEQWLLLEWPRGAAEPTKFWLSKLPAQTSLAELVRLAKHRWVVERDDLELEQELGLAAPQRALLARLSPSREALYGGRRVPGGRAEPFFPLRARRAAQARGSRAGAVLPAAGQRGWTNVAVSRAGSPHCGNRLLARYSAAYPCCLFCGARRFGWSIMRPSEPKSCFFQLNKATLGG